MPHRLPLATQVVEILKGKLREGEWKGSLPAERRLCDELQVSRKTLRTALDQLQRQGWLRMSSTRRRLITIRPARAARRETTGRVQILGATPLDVVHQRFTVVLEDLQKQLYRAGLELQIAISPRFGLHDCARTLSKTVGQMPADCWILWSVQRETHRWFAGRGLPSVVFGSCEADVPLPSVDIDNQAAAQHAVDLLLAKGHKNIALLILQSELAGYHQLERGFSFAVQKLERGRVTARIVHHDGTVEALCRTVESLLQSQSSPTALVVSDALEVLTVLGHLTRIGLRVPADVSIISMGDDPCLRYVIPTVSRYALDPFAFARQLARMVLQTARDGPRRPMPVRIMPRFVAGGSVSAPRRLVT